MHKIHATRITVAAPGTSIFEDDVLHVDVEDEGGGPFIVVSQLGDAKPNKLRFDVEEWPNIRRAINAIARTCNRIEGNER